MTRWTWILALAGLTACTTTPPTDDDTDDTDETDGADTDETDGGDTDDTDDTDEPGPTGPVGSDDHESPTALAIGETGSGSITWDGDFKVPGGTHFWAFTAATAGTYVFTVESEFPMGATWCDGGANAFGCLCQLEMGDGLGLCCTVDASMSCQFEARELEADEVAEVIVYAPAAGTFTYTISVEAAAVSAAR